MGGKCSREKSKPHMLPCVHRVPSLHYACGSGPPEPRNECKNLPWWVKPWWPSQRETKPLCGNVFAAQDIVLRASLGAGGRGGRGGRLPGHSGLVSACHFHSLVKTLPSVQTPISTFPTKRDQVSLRNGCLQVWGSKYTRGIGTTDHV